MVILMKRDVKDLESQLRLDEGEILYAYPDHLGYLTIGVGILIDKRKGGGLRKEESDFILKNRTSLIIEEVKRRLPWVSKLHFIRAAVLYNMVFQLGINGLLNFKDTLKLIEVGNYEAASKEMLNSLWAKSQTPERAKRLSEQMRTCQWQ